ncbi:hypothetical protein Taro_009842 [Colocasia esculenta]|nr:hypothetical protein [Colocasia esculenta]
MYRSID